MNIKAVFLRGQLICLLALSPVVSADQVILDDLIVDGSLCVGADCADGEDFQFDTIRLKADDASIRFQDTSNSAGFPTNDWSMGVTDNAGAGPFRFYIRDENTASAVLLLEGGASGGVALGPGAELEAGAISVGAPGDERRVVNMAAGVDASDGVNRAQFDAFTTATEDGLVDEKAQLDADLADLQDQLDAVTSRIADLAARVDAL